MRWRQVRAESVAASMRLQVRRPCSVVIHRPLFDCAFRASLIHCQENGFANEFPNQTAIAAACKNRSTLIQPMPHRFLRAAAGYARAEMRVTFYPGRHAARWPVRPAQPHSRRGCSRIARGSPSPQTGRPSPPRRETPRGFRFHPPAR